MVMEGENKQRSNRPRFFSGNVESTTLSASRDRSTIGQQLSPKQSCCWKQRPPSVVRDTQGPGWLPTQPRPGCARSFTLLERQERSLGNGQGARVGRREKIAHPTPSFVSRGKKAETKCGKGSFQTFFNCFLFFSIYIPPRKIHSKFKTHRNL